MKLRMKSNSLRLRLMRSEVARMQAGERVEESVQFAPGSNGVLRYTLRVDTAISDDVAVAFESGVIDVRIGAAAMLVWQAEDQIGIYTNLKTGTDTLLEIAIEKDFACLDRSDAENQDTYANPHMGQVC